MIISVGKRELVTILFFGCDVYVVCHVLLTLPLDCTFLWFLMYVLPVMVCLLFHLVSLVDYVL